MGHVQVPTVNDRLDLVQGHKVLPQIVLPLHTIVQPFEPILGVGGVAADQIKLLIFQGDEPTLVVVDILVHPIGYGYRGMGGENGGAGIALFFRRVPILQDSLTQGDVRLALLHLSLLQAQKVRGLLLIKIQKPLFHTGPQAVYIPGNEFHKQLLCNPAWPVLSHYTRGTELWQEKRRKARKMRMPPLRFLPGFCIILFIGLPRPAQEKRHGPTGSFPHGIWPRRERTRVITRTRSV